MDLLAPGAEPTRGAKIRIEDGSNDWWLDRSKVVERSITSGGVLAGLGWAGLWLWLLFVEA